MVLQNYSFDRGNVGDGTKIQESLRVVRVDFDTMPNATTVSQAHGLPAGFTVVDAWVVHVNASSGGESRSIHQSAASSTTTITVDATNINWTEAGDMTGDTAIGYILYL